MHRLVILAAVVLVACADRSDDESNDAGSEAGHDETSSAVTTLGDGDGDGEVDHGHSECEVTNPPTCLELSGRECSDVAVDATCDGGMWACPPGSRRADECQPSGSTSTSTSTSTSGSSSDSGTSGSSGDSGTSGTSGP